MAHQINEPDWKEFKRLLPVAQGRYCERALEELRRAATDLAKDSVERFEAVVRLAAQRAKEYGTLTDFRRSTALFQIVRLRGLETVTDEELARFSAQTQASVKLVLDEE